MSYIAKVTSSAIATLIVLAACSSDFDSSHVAQVDAGDTPDEGGNAGANAGGKGGGSGSSMNGGAGGTTSAGGASGAATGGTSGGPSTGGSSGNSGSGGSGDSHCNEGDSRFVRCGTNGNGDQEQTCVDGSWQDHGACANAFVTVWKTDHPGTSNVDQITLPLVQNGLYDFVVHWGDGSSDAIDTWDAAAKTHTYPEAGTYTVSIEGDINGWAFQNKGDAPKIEDGGPDA